jgi:hypothetical protein
MKRIAAQSAHGMLLFCLALVGVVTAGSPADEGVLLESFSVREAFGVSHPRQVIDFDLAQPVDPRNAYLLDEEGNEAAYQLLRDGKLALVTELPAHGELTWKYLRVGSFHSREWGDWDQYYPSLNKIANYLDLYILGSSGPGRRQRQVLNKYDSCCFAGVRYRTYENHVRGAVAATGNGAFDVYLDESHRSHLISGPALEKAIAPLLDGPRELKDIRLRAAQLSVIGEVAGRRRGRRYGPTTCRDGPRTAPR